MKFKRRNLEALGDLICGNLGPDDPQAGGEPRYFPYRSSMYITEFFQDLDTEWAHDGSTRHRWVADVLDSMLSEPHGGPTHPPEVFCRVVNHLMIPSDAMNEGPDRPNALGQLNEVLAREGFEAFYGEDKHCGHGTVIPGSAPASAAPPSRPASCTPTSCCGVRPSSDPPSPPRELPPDGRPGP